MIANQCSNDELFLCFYRELRNRHMFATTNVSSNPPAPFIYFWFPPTPTSQSNGVFSSWCFLFFDPSGVPGCFEREKEKEREGWLAFVV